MAITDENELFRRSRRLLGDATLEALGRAKVILLGSGGVGNWCAEALVRSGLRHLTIVDCDQVAASNVNRQAMATTRTLGRPKVEAMKERLLEINPTAHITAVQQPYHAETAGDFHLEDYDYVIDAIDTLDDKASLILQATALPVTFFSSMGAALKIDPSQIRSDVFRKVHGCPLARALRHRFKQRQAFPSHDFRCVYSPELLPNLGETAEHESAGPGKGQVNGSLVHITAIYGCTLAGMVIQDIYHQNRPQTL